jgi:hypothetical protein
MFFSSMLTYVLLELPATLVCMTLRASRTAHAIRTRPWLTWFNTPTIIRASTSSLAVLRRTRASSFLRCGCGPSLRSWRPSTTWLFSRLRQSSQLQTLQSFQAPAMAYSSLLGAAATTLADIRRGVASLVSVDAKVIGAMFNAAPQSAMATYGGYYPERTQCHQRHRAG